MATVYRFSVVSCLAALRISLQFTMMKIQNSKCERFKTNRSHVSDRFHNSSVTIPRCYKDVYVNSFFPRTARLRNSIPIECFPVTFDLSGSKSRINRHLVAVGSFWTDFLCGLLFLVTSCLFVVVQPCMEWIRIKKRRDKIKKIKCQLFLKFIIVINH